MIDNSTILVLLCIGATIVVAPVIVFLSVRAGRFAWLSANYRFTQYTDKKEKSNGNSREA